MIPNVLEPEEKGLLSTGAECMLRQSGGGKVGVVVLHPWGPMGGSYDDPHVTTVARYFGGFGCATCRVNFRNGFSRGEGSVLDAVAAADLLLSLESIDGVLVVGYSYGSCVAMRAAERVEKLVGWVALNPPLDYAWFLYFCNWSHLTVAKTLVAHKLLVHATEDVFCSNATFDAFAEGLQSPKTVLRAHGAPHFDVRRAIVPALDRWIRDDLKCADGQAFARGEYDRLPEASRPPVKVRSEEEEGAAPPLFRSLGRTPSTSSLGSNSSSLSLSSLMR